MKFLMHVGMAILMSFSFSLFPMDVFSQFEKACVLGRRPQQMKFGKAIVDCDVATVRAMLEHEKINPNDICCENELEGQYFFPLHRVIERACFMRHLARTQENRPGYKQIIEMLLKYGVDINWQNPINKTYAAESLTFLNDAEWLEYFLEQGADPSILGEGISGFLTGGDSYSMAKHMQDNRNLPATMLVLRKHKDKVKQQIRETVPQVPQGIIGVISDYLLCTDVTEKEKTEAETEIALTVFND